MKQNINMLAEKEIPDFEKMERVVMAHIIKNYVDARNQLTEFEDAIKSLRGTKEFSAEDAALDQRSTVKLLLGKHRALKERILAYELLEPALDNINISDIVD